MDALESFGLSSKEARVYLAALELGESSASDIALKSDMPRTLTYDLLERLIDRGLASYAIKDAKKYFTAADPRELATILSQKQQAIRTVMPMLQELERTKGMKRPKVEVYEGKEGMKTVMNNLLRSGVKEFFAYGSSKVSSSVLPAFFTEWHKERITRKIFFRVIYNDSPETRKRVKDLKHSLAHASYRFMPVGMQSPYATLIYGNRVMMQMWTKDPYAVVIEEETMAKSHRAYFQQLWKLAKA